MTAVHLPIPSCPQPFQNVLCLSIAFSSLGECFFKGFRKPVGEKTCRALWGCIHVREANFCLNRVHNATVVHQPGRHGENYRKPRSLSPCIERLWGNIRSLSLSFPLSPSSPPWSGVGTHWPSNLHAYPLSFRALNTSQLKAWNIEMLPGYRDPYSSRPLTRGEIGCFLSHFSVWKEVNIL